MHILKRVKLRPINVTDISTIAILIAMSYVLSKVGIHTTYIVFTLSFVATAFLGAMYGPVIAGIVAGMMDIMFTFINGSMYIPGFTVSAILGAVIYGSFFYKRKLSVWRIIIAQLIIALVVNTIMNTAWLSIFIPNVDWKVILWPRIIKEIITTPIQIAILALVMMNPVVNKLIIQKWHK